MLHVGVPLHDRYESCISHALTRKDTHNIRESRRDTITPCVAFILCMHLVYYRKGCHLNGDLADQRWQPLASPGHCTSPCIGCREAQTLLPYRRCLNHSVADRTASSLGTLTQTGPSYQQGTLRYLSHDSNPSHFGQHEISSCRSGITSARSI